MTKKRGQSHTTLTETARLFVRVLDTHPGIKMIAPGEIASKRSNSQRCTITYTAAGLDISVSGQGTQKIAVHTESETVAKQVATLLRADKRLRHFSFSERERKPGI